MSLINDATWLSSCFNKYYKNNSDNVHNLDFVYDKLSGLSNAEAIINDYYVLVGFSEDFYERTSVVFQYTPISDDCDITQIDPMFDIDTNWSELELCNSLKGYIAKGIDKVKSL